MLAVGVSIGGGTLLASHLRALRLPRSSFVLAECTKVAVEHDVPGEPWSYDDVDLTAMSRMLEHGVHGVALGNLQLPLPPTTRGCRGEAEAHCGLA